MVSPLVRHQLLNLAGRIVHTVRRCFLLLSECSRYRSIWPFALKRLTILQFVGCLSVDSGFLRPRQTQNPPASCATACPECSRKREKHIMWGDDCCVSAAGLVILL